MQDLLRRLLFAVLTVWGAATLAFFALSVLPGDAIETQLTQNGADAELINARREALGLTDPVIVRYLRFVGHVAQGNLGTSLLSGEPVGDAIARSLGPTVRLALSALVIGSSFGIALGVLAARPSGLFSSVARVITAVALSTPIYWTGTIAIYVFTARLGLLPSAGAGRLSQLRAAREHPRLSYGGGDCARGSGQCPGHLVCTLCTDGTRQRTD